MFPICLDCIAEYVPGVTSFSFTENSCATILPQYWFTVSGEVLTQGGSYGTNSPVNGVTITFYVQEPIPGNSNVTINSAIPTAISIPTDNNGQFSYTFANASWEYQYYQVIGVASRADNYVDNGCTILTQTAPNQPYSLVQVAVGTGVYYDDNSTLNTTSIVLNEFTVNVAFLCQDVESAESVNLTTLSPNATEIVCNMTNAYAANIEVLIFRTNYTTYTDTSLGTVTTYSTNSSADYRYGWIYQITSNLTLNNSATPLQDEEQFLAVETNPYDQRSQIPSTPYLISASEGWLSPSKLIANGATHQYTLVLPPSVDQSACLPLCPPDANLISQYQMIPELVPEISTTVSSLAFGSSVTQSIICVEQNSNAYLQLTLANGFVIQFPFSAVSVSGVVLDNVVTSQTNVTFNITLDIVAPIAVTTADVAYFSLSYLSLILSNTVAQIVPQTYTQLVSQTNVVSTRTFLVFNQIPSGSFSLFSNFDDSNLCITVDGSHDCNDDSSIFTLPCMDGNSYQLFTHTSGHDWLSVGCSGSQLNDPGQHSSPGSSIDIYTNNYVTWQEWTYNSMQQFMVNDYNGLCMSVSQSVHSAILQYNCGDNQIEQQWLMGQWVNGYSFIPLTLHFPHQFLALNGYDSSPLSSVVMTYGQTLLNPMIFFDLSVVPITGRVTLGLNSNLPGIETCSSANIVIQAFAIDDTSYENPIATSLPTSSEGDWTIAVAMQQQYILVPSFVNDAQRILHTFNPSQLVLPVGTQPIRNVNFIDTTTNELQVTLVGGLCGSFVANVKPLLIVPSCGNRKFTLPTTYSNIPSQSYSLPAIAAQFMSYTGNSRDQTGVQGGSIVDAIPPALINAWLVSNGNFFMNLTVGNQTQTLTYYTDPVVTLKGPTYLRAAPCIQGTTKPFFILPGETTINITFQLTEQYNGVGLCNQVDPNRIQVWVHDQLSADLSTTCSVFGCPIVPYWTGSYTYAWYQTTLGEPYLFKRTDGGPDYTRDIKYGVYQSVTRESNVLSVLITGTVAYEGLLSLKVAPSAYKPLYILRDPPGQYKQNMTY